MAKKKTLPKTLKQKAVSLFKNEKEEYAYYLKEYKEKIKELRQTAKKEKITLKEPRK